MQSNPLQTQQQEWLIGLNNRLIDMNERLIEQRGQDQQERELLLQIVQNNESHCPVTVQETVPRVKVCLMSGRDFQSEEDPKPALSQLFLRSKPKAVPLSLMLHQELMPSAGFRNGQHAPRLSSLFM
jgi:hypothetical protein